MTTIFEACSPFLPSVMSFLESKGLKTHDTSVAPLQCQLTVCSFFHIDAHQGIAMVRSYGDRGETGADNTTYLRIQTRTKTKDDETKDRIPTRELQRCS